MINLRPLKVCPDDEGTLPACPGTWYLGSWGAYFWPKATQKAPPDSPTPNDERSLAGPLIIGGPSARGFARGFYLRALPYGSIPSPGVRGGPEPYTVGRCADGALGDTPGVFKVEHREILVQS